MTTERQAEVQRSIMTMLGDRRAAAASSSVPPKASQSSGGSTVTFVPPPAVPVENNNERSEAPLTPNQNSTDSWKCSVCTLNNALTLEICEACETARQH